MNICSRQFIGYAAVATAIAFGSAVVAVWGVGRGIDAALTGLFGK